MISSIGGGQPVTLDAPVMASSLGRGRSVESGGDVVDGERAVGVAFDEPAAAQPGPRQQVGVVLDDGGDHDVVGLRGAAGRRGG